MDFQESNLARLLLAAGLPSQVHSRLGSGSSSSPCTPAMQRAHLSQVYTNISHHPCPPILNTFCFCLVCSIFSLVCTSLHIILFKIVTYIVTNDHVWTLYFPRMPICAPVETSLTAALCQIWPSPPCPRFAPSSHMMMSFGTQSRRHLRWATTAGFGFNRFKN